MGENVKKGEFWVEPEFAAFVENEFAPWVNKAPDEIWSDLAHLDNAFNARINEALELRQDLQSKIDEYFKANPSFEQVEYERFLQEIGYFDATPESFEIITQNVDDEVAKIAAPQLVVPISNARFALNAANARWVSLYDALYGTNAIMDVPKTREFDPDRAKACATFFKLHLDRVAPIEGATWAEISNLRIENGALFVDDAKLADQAQFAGYRGEMSAPEEVLLRVNGLIIRLVFNQSEVAKLDPLGLGDVIVEGALTTIMDCEDSVAAVDGADKAHVYRNWLGLNRGDLQAKLQKNGREVTRELNSDIDYHTPDGQSASLKGRSLMFVRNVGHLMRNPAMLRDERQIYEGLLDAYFTIGIASQNQPRAGYAANSNSGAIYVVKPKMHGAGEVHLSCDIFAHVEDQFSLTRDCVKLGIMDEERRTSANLAACIEAAKSRVAFINTGFLDRTGDEIHTHMYAGFMIPKAEMKTQGWLDAYEKRNVEIGLACGLQGRAQIGKGMWAKPEDMRGLLAEKIGQPKAGATTAWVPSPTAAALHALHYHMVDVFAVQNEIKNAAYESRIEALLTPPLARARVWDEAEIADELANNLQGILGYVVRWVDQGVGCSTVPDIHDVGLMEDRATCRISAQMVANWLLHGLIFKPQIEESLQKVRAIVDRQNADDPNYQPISDNGAAMSAVRDLVYHGVSAPSGYTEPALHAARLAKKAENA